MRSLFRVGSRRLNLAAAAGLVMVAVLSPILAFDCPYYGQAKKCTTYLVTPCPNWGDCLTGDHCDLGVPHMVVNSWDTFPGCKVYQTLPTDYCNQHPYGCYYILYGDSYCTDFGGIVYPFCFCECYGDLPPPG